MIAVPAATWMRRLPIDDQLGAKEGSETGEVTAPDVE
jgi:hypothetical protein